MKSCILCPKGRKCRGTALHELLLRLCEAMLAGGDADAIARALSREDAELLAEKGMQARSTCWTKAFVMTAARKVADLSKTARNEAELRANVEQTVVRMDMLFAKLPKGVGVDFESMAMEVYNQSMELMRAEGGMAAIPAGAVGNALFQVSRAKGAA